MMSMMEMSGNVTMVSMVAANIVSMYGLARQLYSVTRTLVTDQCCLWVASTASGTRGMARNVAREMLYRLRAPSRADSWRAARHWTVSPDILASLTGRKGSSRSRRVKEARDRSTDSSGRSSSLAPALAAMPGR